MRHLSRRAVQELAARVHAEHLRIQAVEGRQCQNIDERADGIRSIGARAAIEVGIKLKSIVPKPQMQNRTSLRIQKVDVILCRSDTADLRCNPAAEDGLELEPADTE